MTVEIRPIDQVGGDGEQGGSGWHEGGRSLLKSPDAFG